MKTLLALAACALLLAACGSSDSGSDSGTGSSSDDRDTARLKLQECLRKQGITPPERAGSSPRRASAAERQKLQKAIQGACKQYAQGAFGEMTDEQRQELQDKFAKFSACMRQHGVDIPDMRPGQGPQRLRVNPNSARFKAAAKACEKLRPQRPGGGGDGPGAGLVVGGAPS